MSQGGVNAQNIPLPVPLSLGGSGQVLTAKPITTLKVTRVTATGAGTYTPTTGMQFVVVRAQGAGGGAGGAATSASNQAAIGAAGGGGGYVEALFTAAQIGASKAYSVGAKGTGGAAGNNAGTDGGDTTFNTTWIVAGGGKLGTGGAATSTTLTQFFGAGGAGGGVSVSTGVAMMLIPGEKTDTSGMNLGTLQTRNAVGGAAGSGYPGGEFSINSTGAATAGSSAAANSGAGGSAGQTMVASQVAGGDGGDGWIEFIEYITQ